MSEAMDICMNCTVKGDIDACLKTPCSQHNSWFAKTIIAEAEKQEPVAWMTIDSNGEEDDIWYDNPEGKLLEGWSCKPLYTHPQPRKPLTDEQKKSIARRAFKDICKDYPVQDRIILVINDIEAAHGIKE